MFYPSHSTQFWEVVQRLTLTLYTILGTTFIGLPHTLHNSGDVAERAPSHSTQFWVKMNRPTLTLYTILGGREW